MNSLLLADSDKSTPAEVVTWFGAMQSQDLASGKWSFGVRLPAMTEADIDAAIESGTVLRTWPMRRTLHFVAPADARWMLESTGSRALNGLQARWDRLGLDEATVTRCADLLGQALAGNRRLTRTDALAMLTDHGIDVSGQRAYHIIWYSSQIGVTCIGPNVGKEQTLVRLDEWAPDPVIRDESDALREIALRFVRSHGPVTHQDLARWAGIAGGSAKRALSANDDAITPVDVGGVTMWAATDQVAVGDVPAAVALPGFDEFMLGYKNRSAVLADESKDLIVPGNNGVFRPTLVLDGQVVATWRRTPRAKADVISIETFRPLTRPQQKKAESAFEAHSRYLGRELQIRFV